MNQLFFRKSGSGPAIVVLHGLYGTSDNWVSISKRLENRYTVYLVDHRNHGQSPHFDSHTYEDMVQDIRNFVLDQEISTFTILGHSMGGKVAMLYALNYPENIDRLIVADIAPRNYFDNPFTPKQMTLHYTIFEAMQSIDFSKVKTRSEINEQLQKYLKPEGLRNFILKNIKRTEESFEWKINVPVLAKSVKFMMGGASAETFADRKPILSYPVLFLRGLNSKYIQDSEIDSIMEIYPEARIVDIPDAGHWLHSEQPDLFVEAVNG